MLAATSCRLCFSCDNCDDYLNIFGTTGDGLRINDMISEHFRCDVSEGDSLPNFVCQVCWTITESFHELYHQSKLAQEAFLNSTIKIEGDPVIVYPESNECNFVVDGIKLEPNADPANEEDTEEEDALESVPDSNVLDTVSDEVASNPESKEHSANKPKKYSRKEYNSTFWKLFNENKHRLDLSCDKCTKKFETLEDAQRHYPAKHNISEGYIKCTNGKCKIKLKRPSAIVQHLNHHLNPEKFKCSECDKVLNSRAWFKIHMERHRGTETKTGTEHDMADDSAGRSRKAVDPYTRFMAENFDMTCDLCDTKFTSFINARCHYKNTHSVKRGYVKCCKTKLRDRPSVNEHINSHLNPGIFSCDTCKKSFPTKNRLYQHTYRHKRNAERPYTCDMCGESFSQKVKILRHFFAKHVFDSEHKFECEICNKRFPVIDSLRSHMNSVHREKKPIVTCEICGKSFSLRAHLKMHMQTHVDKSERLFQQRQCEHCGEWLMSKSGVYYHEQIHSKNVQKCGQCEMELPNRIALLAHNRNHHRAHVHKCKLCDKAFTVKSLLKKHEETHTRHRTYPCQFCAKVFTLSISRLTHQKRSHPDELEELRKMRKLNRHLPTSS